MWKSRVSSVSNAEYEILADLSKLGLNRFLTTQQPFEFDYEEDGVYGTSTDLYYNLPKPYVCFIDGEQIHDSKRMDKDELITKALERRGYLVDRFSYESPLRKSRRKEIVDRIEARLTELGYFEEILKLFGDTLS